MKLKSQTIAKTILKPQPDKADDVIRASENNVDNVDSGTIILDNDNYIMMEFEYMQQKLGELFNNVFEIQSFNNNGINNNTL